MKLNLLGTEGRFAYEGLDRVIHERARLSVLTSLITNPKGLHLRRPQAALRSHRRQSEPPSRVLEKAKMVEIIKGHDHNRPQTVCRITASGRKRYLEYLSTLEQVVRDAANGTPERRCSCACSRPDPVTNLKFFARRNFAVQSTFKRDEPQYSQRTARRHHHGRQRPLGHAARIAPCRRPSRRGCCRPSRCRARTSTRHPRLTLYAFSSDNWAVRRDEVQSIFWFMRAFLRLETRTALRARRTARSHRPPRSLASAVAARN